MKKILITGVTGYIGGTIAKKLLDRNYEVTGLVRNETHVQELESLGIKTIVGNIHDEDLIRTAVSDADAVIHNADSADDAYAADNFIKALEGSQKTFIFTSGSAIFGGKENGKKVTLSSQKISFAAKTGNGIKSIDQQLRPAFCQQRHTKYCYCSSHGLRRRPWNKKRQHSDSGSYQLF